MLYFCCSWKQQNITANAGNHAVDQVFHFVANWLISEPCYDRKCEVSCLSSIQYWSSSAECCGYWYVSIVNSWITAGLLIFSVLCCWLASSAYGFSYIFTLLTLTAAKFCVNYVCLFYLWVTYLVRCLMQLAAYISVVIKASDNVKASPEWPIISAMCSDTFTHSSHWSWKPELIL